MSLNKTDKVYHDLLKDILENGHQKGDRTGTGTTSVFGRQIRFNMKDGFPLLTTKKLHTKSIIHELIWFLSGDTNIEYLQENKVSIWDEWADLMGDLGPVYGKQWVDWSGKTQVGLSAKKNDEGYYEYIQTKTNGINQIKNLINSLMGSPDSRRIMVSAWNVGEIEQMALPPCHYGFQVWTRELSYKERYDMWNKKNPTLDIMTDDELFDNANIPKREISLMWNQRSVDTGLGLPFNIASYGLLLEMIAQQTNMIAGELIGNLGDVHIYDNHIEQIQEQLTRESKTDVLPKLKLNKVDTIFDYKFEDFEIVDYDTHSTIKMPIAV
jgi:thymidylate synthase